MSYVDWCNTHGEYKGDYCGECIEATQIELEQFRECVVEARHYLNRLMDNYKSLPSDINMEDAAKLARKFGSLLRNGN